jgi:Pyruvate/2-oxoacid:ferredoxin oxidoreductase delta subunit/biotin operon repressor
MMSDPYQELCSRMMAPGSARLEKIFRSLCDELDAKLVLAMPGTVAELAAATGMAVGEVETRIEGLFHRGVAFFSDKEKGRLWRGPRHLIQLHDASMQWKEATREYIELFRDFMNEEMPPMLAMMLQAGIPSFMRTVPALKSLDKVEGLLDIEDLRKIVQAVDEIAVCRCPCRLSEQNCDNELETCIQFNKGARYNIERGTGREISKDECMQILTDAEEAGLIHMIDNKPGIGTFVCNCCTCCCEIMRPYQKGPEFKEIFKPSRFVAEVEYHLCSMDEACVAVCPVSAITIDESLESADVDAELCIGCGLCVGECPVDAIRLKEVRPPEYIEDR